jgi:hypothetical protein
MRFRGGIARRHAIADALGQLDAGLHEADEDPSSELLRGRVPAVRVQPRTDGVGLSKRSTVIGRPIVVNSMKRDLRTLFVEPAPIRVFAHHIWVTVIVCKTPQVPQLR